MCSGLYTNFYRHKKTCEACSPHGREIRIAKAAKKRKREIVIETLSQGKKKFQCLIILSAEQPPAVDWNANRVNRETGLTLNDFTYVEHLCHQELLEIATCGKGLRKLSPRNALLLTLKWLRRYPVLEDLAVEFNVSRRRALEYQRDVLDVLDSKLEYLRRWPLVHRSKILTGPLQGTVGAVDTFPVCIPQPESTEDRKQFFIYKPGHHTRYGYKVQTFVDLHGMILDVTDAHPFGSKADITLFRESCVPSKLNPDTRAMAPAPINLASRVESRITRASDDDKDAKIKDSDDLDNKHSRSNESKEDEAESIPNISNALSEAKALGDKAYIGSELIYVPHKKFKNKRFTKAKKEFNKLVSSKRVIVENVNKRLEDFRILGTIYRGARESGVVSKIVRVIVSLHNLTLPSHPLRKQRRRAARSA